MRQLGEGFKEIRHPVAGLLSLECSTFSVDGRPDLAMLVYNPADEATAQSIRRLIGARASAV